MKKKAKSPPKKTTTVHLTQFNHRHFYVKAVTEDGFDLSQAMTPAEALADGAGMTRKRAAELVEDIARVAVKHEVRTILVTFHY